MRRGRVTAILDSVRHATEEDLDRIDTLLEELRKLAQLRERKRGYFSWRSKAFMHFHEDSGDIYVDVKLDDKFERMKVSSPAEQAAFLSRVRETLAPGVVTLVRAALSAGPQRAGTIETAVTHMPWRGAPEGRRAGPLSGY